MKLYSYLISFLKWLDIIGYTKEELMMRINKKHKNNPDKRCVEILSIYEKELDDLYEANKEEYYKKVVDICAKYKLYFPIPDSGSC